MAGFPLRDVRRWGFVTAFTLVSGMGLTVIACSSNKGTVQAEKAAINIQTSPFSVTVENTSGLPLTNLNVAILSVGGLPYTDLIARLEVAEKRELSFRDFSARGGTTFNTRVARPKSVRVTAKDIGNKDYQVEVPWK
jgi:hypothetical protein